MFPRRRVRFGAFISALVLSVAAGIVGMPEASAAPMSPKLAGKYQDLLVPSSMGPIKVQVQWAKRGGGAALYLLDGMRARNDRNGWELETNARQQFANDNVTLVMPVGGQSSFYTDWYAPASMVGDGDGQHITYKWETFLTGELPAYLAKFGVSSTDNAILGLSMGGGAALTLAAYHHHQFKFAGSLSGFLNPTAPGMRDAIRIAMLGTGPFYNVDAMWGGPSDPKWRRNDPVLFAPRLRGLSLFIATGDGIPGPVDRMDTPDGVVGTFTGVGLELLAMLTSRTFHARLTALGLPAVWDFGLTGTHEWGYWQSELAKAHNQILDAVNGH